MQIRFHCPTDDCVAIIELEPFEDCDGTIRCPRCNVEHAIRITESIRSQHQLDLCTVCGASEMFLRKDFPQKLGILVVLIAGAISLSFLKSDLRIAYGVLGIAILVDLILYLWTGLVTSCYACRAEYRKVTPNPSHEGFDLATSEKY